MLERRKIALDHGHKVKSTRERIMGRSQAKGRLNQASITNDAIQMSEIVHDLVQDDSYLPLNGVKPNHWAIKSS
jgi:hypothetical protein